MPFAPPPFRASRPLKGGQVLLGYQQRWVADESPLKLASKSRRIGLSYTEAFDAVLHCAAAGAANYYFQGFNTEMTRGFIGDCQQHARALNTALAPVALHGGDRDEKTYALDFDSGASINALPAKARNFRSKGRPGERFFVDECRDILEFPALVEAALPCLMWDSRLAFCSTSAAENSAWQQFLRDCESGKLKGASIHTIAFDDAVADGLYRRICEVRGAKWTAADEEAFYFDVIAKTRNPEQELFCVAGSGSGAWITAAEIDECGDAALPAVARWRPPPGFGKLSIAAQTAEMRRWMRAALPRLLDNLPRHRQVVGGDFARAGDKSVLVALAQGGDSELLAAALEMDDCPFHAQEAAGDMLIAALRDRGGFAGGWFDARGNGQFFAESMAKRHPRCTPVMTAQKFYAEEMPPLRARLQERTLRLPRDADLAADLLSVELRDGVARIGDARYAGADGTQRHGDAAVALAMALAAHRHAPAADWSTFRRGEPSSRGRGFAEHYAGERIASLQWIAGSGIRSAR